MKPEIKLGKAAANNNLTINDDSLLEQSVIGHKKKKVFFG